MTSHALHGSQSGIRRCITLSARLPPGIQRRQLLLAAAMIAAGLVLAVLGMCGGGG